jgi:WD40 repeat protein
MWDIESRKVISDVGGQHLAGYVRSVVVDPERRLMMTACEKNITIWDMVNMEVVSTLKGHKDDIRTLYMADGVLFSGGKSNANSSSLFIWDLRSSQAVDEKERNQDILSIVNVFLYTRHLTQTFCIMAHVIIRSGE